MSIFYFILRLFLVADDCAERALVNAILCVSDALWIMVIGKFFGWW